MNHMFYYNSIKVRYLLVECQEILDRYFDSYMTLHKNNTKVTDDEIQDGGRGKLVVNETPASR